MAITVPENDLYLGQTCYNTQAGCAENTVSSQICTIIEIHAFRIQNLFPNIIGMNFTRSSATYPDLDCKGSKYKSGL